MANNGNASHQQSTSVVISASGRVNGTEGSKLIHLISVTQPVQSWTVYRDHEEFLYVGNVLSSLGLPMCPAVPSFQTNNITAEITNTRNDLQTWLSSVLLYPGASSNQYVQHLLCNGANHPPPAQYESINWFQFVSSTSLSQHAHHQSQEYSGSFHSASNTSHCADELEMDDMFYEEGEDHDEEEDHYDDDGEYFSATERYQPTEEEVTKDDVMEFQNNADDVEMIEDVGSLAQSLGASHLGRSLQLQAEISRFTKKGAKQHGTKQGLSIGGGVVSPSGNAGSGTGGGIGNAIINASPAVMGLSDSFFQKKPISAPRLDSFKMIKVIGKGSFGKVFLVKEKRTTEMFALKVLRKDNIIRRNQVEHTKTERNVLGYVNHPFIVGLKMAFQSKDKLYFVLDYCAGGELFFHLSKIGKFGEYRASFYAAEIVLALAYIHKMDIVYRDLKPENVLLDARGHIRLTDFGLSKEGISLSSSGAHSFCGTPEYLAPEILERKGHGRAVDWWSLGALLYEMLTGLPPFYCRDRDRLFEKIKGGSLEYPACLSARAQNILKGLLTKDPQRRLGSDSKDADTIKNHPFFGGMKWEQLYAGEVSPPWDPEIHGSLDTSQFDEEFTRMPILSPSSYQAHNGYYDGQPNPFEGFTFTDRRFYGENTLGDAPENFYSGENAPLAAPPENFHTH